MRGFFSRLEELLYLVTHRSFPQGMSLYDEWEEPPLSVPSQLVFLCKEGVKKSRLIWKFGIFVYLWIVDERCVQWSGWIYGCSASLDRGNVSAQARIGAFFQILRAEAILSTISFVMCVYILIYIIYVYILLYMSIYMCVCTKTPVWGVHIFVRLGVISPY